MPKSPLDSKNEQSFYDADQDLFPENKISVNLNSGMLFPEYLLDQNDFTGFCVPANLAEMKNPKKKDESAADTQPAKNQKSGDRNQLPSPQPQKKIKKKVGAFRKKNWKVHHDTGFIEYEPRLTGTEFADKNTDELSSAKPKNRTPKNTVPTEWVPYNSELVELGFSDRAISAPIKGFHKRGLMSTISKKYSFLLDEVGFSREQISDIVLNNGDVNIKLLIKYKEVIKEFKLKPADLMTIMLNPTVGEREAGLKALIEEGNKLQAKDTTGMLLTKFDATQEPEIHVTTNSSISSDSNEHLAANSSLPSHLDWDEFDDFFNGPK